MEIYNDNGLDGVKAEMRGNEILITITDKKSNPLTYALNKADFQMLMEELVYVAEENSLYEFHEEKKEREAC